MLKKNTKKIKRYRDYDFDANAYVVKHYVEGEKAVIPITMEQYQDLFSSYHPNDMVLNRDIMEYIERIVYYIPYQYSIVLEFIGPEFTEEEKIHISEALSNHFGLRAHDKKVDLKFNTNKAIILLIFGFVFLYISYLISSYVAFKFINDVVSIAGTFSIWEFVNTLWLERTGIRISSLNAGQLATATIDFKERIHDK